MSAEKTCRKQAFLASTRGDTGHAAFARAGRIPGKSFVPRVIAGNLATPS
jgi:hypothetical protein